MGYRKPAKYKDVNGGTIPTVAIRIPAYLKQEVEEYVKQLHSVRQGREESEIDAYELVYSEGEDY